MPVLAPPQRRQLGPDQPVRSPGRGASWGVHASALVCVLLGAPAASALLWQVVLGHDVVRTVAAGQAWPQGLLAAVAVAPVLLWLLARGLAVFTGGPPAELLRALAWPLLLAWPALALTLGTLPPESESQAPVGMGLAAPGVAAVQAGALAAMLGLTAGAGLGAFLRQATLRGARLMLPRWRSRRLPRVLEVLAVVAMAFIIFSPRLGQVMQAELWAWPLREALPAMPERVVASALLVSMALAIMRLAVLATGSAAVGGAAGLAWLLMLSDPRMLVPPYLPESLGAAVFMLGLLAFHERRFRLHAACVVLACAVHPMVLLFVPFWAVFAAFSLREGGWGLMWLAAASIALLSWTMLTLVFTSGASLPQEIQHVGMFLGDDARRVTEGWVLGALALLLPVGALALMRPGAALLLLPPALVWGAPVLMFPTATFQPGYPAVAPLCLAMIFYAAVQSAHRFAFGRVLLPGSEDEAQAVVAASPASPPPPLPPLREAELWRDRPVAAIPRPWTVQQLIRLRCLVAFLVVAPLSLQLIRLLQP